jgi:hypothetical protein
MTKTLFLFRKMNCRIRNNQDQPFKLKEAQTQTSKFLDDGAPKQALGAELAMSGGFFV